MDRVRIVTIKKAFKNWVKWTEKNKRPETLWLQYMRHLLQHYDEVYAELQAYKKKFPNFYEDERKEIISKGIPVSDIEGLSP